jgi:hypothetical protein
MAETASCSFLDLINDGDNVALKQGVGSARFLDTNHNDEPLVPWYVSTKPSGRAAVGLLRPAIVAQLRKENDAKREARLPEVWGFAEESQNESDETAAKTTLYVTFKTWVGTPAKRTAAMGELCERWRDEALFPDVCGPSKWRAEMYPVYARPFGKHDYPADEGAWESADAEMNFVFEMERSACALFGVVTYGVHMTIFREVEDPEGGPSTIMVWVPKRASTKQTCVSSVSRWCCRRMLTVGLRWPGYLDNSVAGGITSGMGPFESIVKESMEEASLEETIVRKHAKSVGAISYFFR